MEKRKYKSKFITAEEKEINKIVGNNLKSARLNRVICRHNIDVNGNKNAYYVKKFCTQTEMAKAINVAFQQIGKYEKGINGLSVYRVMQLSNFLNIPITQLLEFENQTTQPLNNSKKLVGQYEPPINSSKDRDCSLSSEL